MPANFEELRESLEKADCPTPDATAEYIVNSVFDPIDTPCNSSPAPEVIAGEAGL